RRAGPLPGTGVRPPPHCWRRRLAHIPFLSGRRRAALPLAALPPARFQPSELERRGLEHRLGLLAAELVELRSERLVLEREERHGEKRRVGGAGIADGEGRHRDA